jgi:NAD(P)-dependent dehydrogenase (short-subunit alcohol dehydrogenase family)
VITGSGRGLGREFALAVSAQGARVVVNDIDSDEAAQVVAEITARGGTAVASGHSVADPRQASDLVELCVSAFGRIDGLVNNAGLSLTGAPWAVSPSDVDRVVDVNVKGLLYCGIAALARMKEQRSGVVVNLTSRTHLGWNDAAVYAATKGAAAAVTFSWAIDMAEFGVRVVALAPTAMTRMAVPGSDAPAPSLVAPVIAYLLSDRARRLSGQIFRFNGQQLSLLRPGVFDEPVIERDGFTAAEIADVVDSELIKYVATIGVAGVDLSELPF